MQREERIQRIRQLQQQSQNMVKRPRVEGLPPATNTTLVPYASVAAAAAKVVAPPTIREAQVVGIANIGNTCYMNSVLECFRHCSPFMKYLYGPAFHRDRSCFMNRKPMEQAFVGEFRELLRVLEEEAPDKAPQPVMVLRLLLMFNPVFANYQQADAAECINTMLQVLHTGLTINVTMDNKLGSGESEEVNLQRLGNARYKGHIESSGYSIIEEAFGSQFLSRLECERCGHVSFAHDAYTVVPVPIPDRAFSLYDCFEAFSEPEVVQSVSCERCAAAAKEANQPAQLGPAKKTLTFWSLPTVFIVHLKRFDHNLRKIEKFVQAPMVLNMSRYVTHPRVQSRIRQDPQALQLYDLRGIICHSGQLGGGHYTAKCFRKARNGKADTGTWYEFNDAVARPVQSTDDLQSPLNYMFFYEMQESTKRFWPR